AGHTRMKGSRIEYPIRSHTDPPETLLISNADQITAFGHTEDAIGAAVIGPVHFGGPVIEPIILGLAVLPHLVELDLLFNPRSSLRIGDDPGDNAATPDVEAEIFDLLPLGDIERLATSTHITITRRDIARRDRRDRISSGGHAGKSKSPVLIGP